MHRGIRYSLLVALLLFLLGPLLQKIDPFERVFRALPVQYQGRIKPMDTVARNALLQLSSKQFACDENQHTITACYWLMQLTMNSSKADAYPCFYVTHPEVLSFLKQANDKPKRLAYKAIEPHLKALYIAAEGMKEPLSTFEKQLKHLCTSLGIYQSLKYSLIPTDPGLDPFLEYKAWLESIPLGTRAIQAKAMGQSYEDKHLECFIQRADMYLRLARVASLGLAPEGSVPQWPNSAQLYLDCLLGTEPPALLAYMDLFRAYQEKDLDTFTKAAETLTSLSHGSVSLIKLRIELIFNQLQYFYKLALLYVWVFVLIGGYWIFKRKALYHSLIYTLHFTFVAHSIGMALRMYLQGRPPVTNLYSSAVFVAWAGVGLCIAFEYFHKNGFMACVASMLGSIALTVAHHLSIGEETIEVMRAVLDSNFWLSTHVVTVALGYSSMFVTGFLGIVYVGNGLLKARAETLDKLYRMAYGTACFALLFSFVGTMLGGLWADMSWGRFWGWDPKENGALLIILWGAIALHARIGKIVGQRGFMLMSIFGNIVTAWSWFGTNMLGVGLHSYGFIDKAFSVLAYFVLSQVLCMALGLCIKPKTA